MHLFDGPIRFETTISIPTEAKFPVRGEEHNDLLFVWVYVFRNNKYVYQ